MSKTKKEIMENVVDCVDSRLLANNTVKYEKEDGTVVIRLHLTDIITFNTDNTVVLNSGGYKTKTTKSRINEFAPVIITQKSSVWYVYYSGKEYIFKDGITLYPDGTVTGYGAEENNKKEINKFIDGYMDKLIKREISKPSGGDCWYCYLFESNDTEHFFSHFKEKYYVPSLLFNAIKEFPISPVAQNQIAYYLGYHDNNIDIYENISKHQIKSSLKKFLYSKIGIAY
jgi:hypothetical protein